MAAATKTDEVIREDVLEELNWDPEISANDVGVEVDDGVVTLSGTVDSYTTKEAADRAAFRIQGVRAVANEIAVKPLGTSTDPDLARDAAAAIEANSLVPRDRIDISVKNGKITLAGEVDWEFQRTAAVATVARAPGVHDVTNLILVKPAPVSESEVRAGIERALVRDAEIDADRIRVRSSDGHVTLTGTVHSWAEKRNAGEAAWRAKGVTEVTNEIVVIQL